jgi:glycosyltransferase involved in cell wall biosynthesis
MKVLFLSCESSGKHTQSAYCHRLESLRNALGRQGIQTDFLSLRDQPVGRPILAQPLSLPFMRQKMSDCDFIHAGGNAAFAAVFSKPYTRARVIHDVHGDALSEAQLEHSVRQGILSAYWVFQARVVNAMAYRHSDYFLVVSKPQQQRLMEERQVSSDRIALIRNGVDVKLFCQFPRSRNGSFLVGYAGGFQLWQGIDMLVKAVQLLPRNGLRLRIIGFESRHAAFRSSIAQLLGERAELVDRVSQLELISELAAADVLIIPRPNHPAVAMAFPTKFSEYLALGKPVIVCDIDETSQLVREHRCGLVSKPDPASLAETIRAAAHLSPDELNLMGQNARRLAEREFSWEQIGREYAEQLVRWSAQ